VILTTAPPIYEAARREWGRFVSFDDVHATLLRRFDFVSLNVRGRLYVE